MAQSREIFIFGFRGFPKVQGGIEKHVSELAPRLAANGLPITACFRSPYTSADCGSEWKGVRLCRLWTPKSTYFETIVHSIICAVVACYRRPALVHIHGIGPALVTPLVRLFGLPVVVTHHGADYDREKWGTMARLILRWGEAAGMKYANRRIVISRSIQSQVRAKYRKECEVIPNGVFLPELPAGKDRVETLGLEPGRYVLLVGRLVPEKRHLDAVRAFALSRPPGWKLVVVGQADHASGYADDLAREAALNPNVVMAGLRTGEDLHQLYAHAGLFVLPSSHEGLPIVLLEALSYGVQVLASDIPANREVVDDAARLFRMGDVAELSARFSALADASPDVGNHDPLRRDWVHRFNWDNIANQTAMVYSQVLRPSAGVPRKSRHAARGF